MTITIPIWLLWTVGSIAAIVGLGFVCFFALLGWKLRNIGVWKR